MKPVYAFLKEEYLIPQHFSSSSIDAAYPLKMNSFDLTQPQANSPHAQHHYEGSNSFTYKMDINTSLLLQQRKELINENIRAKSNILNLSLNERVHINLSAHIQEGSNTHTDYTLSSKHNFNQG